MPLALGTGDTIQGKVDVGSDVNYFIDGDAVTVSDAYDLLASGQLATAAAALYTVPGATSAIVGSIRIVNTNTTTTRVVTLYRQGTATTNEWTYLRLGPQESAEWVDGVGWQLYDSNGLVKENQTIPQGYALKSVQYVTATGTYTAPSGVRALMIHAIGAGGGGGGASSAASSAACPGGGGSGAYSRVWITSPPTSYSVTINAVGTAGTNAGGNGGNGGDVTVGSVLTAKGGTGGIGQVAGTTVAGAAGGAGGAAASGVGDFKSDGNAGVTGFRFSGTQGQSGGGSGAEGPFGGGGVASPSAGGAGTNGKNYGGGGSGALVLNASAAAIGGTGGPGVVVVEEYF